MSESDRLIVARLRVYDHVAKETFTVKLEDVVIWMEDAHKPGEGRGAIVALLNEHLLERHPEIGNNPKTELEIDIDDYSELKFEVVRKLALVKTPPVDAPSGRPAGP